MGIAVFLLALVIIALFVPVLIFDLPGWLRELRDRRAERALREMKYFNIFIR
jgi:hypothetical protein